MRCVLSGFAVFAAVMAGCGGSAPDEDDGPGDECRHVVRGVGGDIEVECKETASAGYACTCAVDSDQPPAPSVDGDYGPWVAGDGDFEPLDAEFASDDFCFSGFSARDQAALAGCPFTPPCLTGYPLEGCFIDVSCADGLERTFRCTAGAGGDACDCNTNTPGTDFTRAGVCALIAQAQSFDLSAAHDVEVITNEECGYPYLY
jgi:hypothetical protein